jgi:low temperature requirement protein LtrA
VRALHGLPQAYGDRGILFGVAAAATGPMLLLGGLLDGTARIALWAGAALVDTTVPLVLRRRPAASAVRFEPSHLPERFGLLLIVALGAPVVAGRWQSWRAGVRG